MIPFMVLEANLSGRATRTPASFGLPRPRPITSLHGQSHRVGKPVSRWLVVGAKGMLGQDLLAALGDSEVTALDQPEIDIRDPYACRVAVADHDFVVNVAAWTAVDEAETHEAEAFAVNAVGAANLARACSVAGARMLQVSTDYVFAGDASTPYSEDAPLSPQSAYGRTKAAGEWAVQAYCPQSWIVRTAWLYGAHGPNFVKTMARLAAEKDTLSVVDDQIGQPTWTVDLAAAIMRLIEAKAPFGTYHGTSAGSTTWFGFTQAIFAELGLDPSRVKPTTTDAFPRPAPRPAYSVLGHEAWRGAALDPLPSWRESVTTAVPIVAAR
jgi:dTDP-4-dehydrorhamnose reductase